MNQLLACGNGLPGPGIPRSISILPILGIILAFAQQSVRQHSSADEINDYYVSADAGVNGDGSQSKPFLLLSQAESASAAGDTIYLVASNRAGLLDGGIALKPRQKLIGTTANGQFLDSAGSRVQITNTSDHLNGVIVQLSDHNEIAGIHFVNMRSYAISASGSDYSGTYIHHSSFSGNATEHIEDERGLVYAISLDATEGDLDGIRIEDSNFRDGHDLGGIRVFHSGNSRGNYHFQRNDFSDLGGRAYFVQSLDSSRVETVILD